MSDADDRQVHVVGGGLLGGALLDRLGPAGHHVASVAWTAHDAAIARLEDVGQRVGAHPAWRLAWCAGSGVVGAGAVQMARERELLEALVRGLAHAGAPGGRLFVASSAGGVHGRGDHHVATEASAPSPRSPYGEGKLAVEEVGRLAASSTGAEVLLGRISNLYGPGQQLGKGSGFLSHACASALQGRPVVLRVPLDTTRDFVHAGDVAARAAAWLHEPSGGDAPSATVKLLVSGQAVTLSRAVTIIQAVVRRRVLLVHAADPSSAQQPRHLRFRSTVRVDLDHAHPARPLESGVLELVASLRQRLVRAA